MGSRGDCYDNALCESFFATLECELLERSSFRTPIEARMAVFDFVEGWYNPHRRHSSLENHSPVSYERRYDQASAVVGTVGECKVCSVNETSWFPSGKSSVLYSLVKSNLSRNPKADMMAIRLSIFGLKARGRGVRG